MRKRIIAMVLALVMALGVLTAAAGAADTKKVVALGDSIAAGYGVESEQSYTALVAGKLGAELTNLAVSGSTSADVLAAAKSAEGKAALADADVVTISVGGNNALVPLFAAVMKEFGITEKDIADKGGIQNIISDQMSDPTALIKKFNSALASAKTGIDAGIAAFTKEFPEIIKAVKAAAPNAQIIVNTLYNPYYGVKIAMVGFDVETFSETFTKSINNVINANAATLGYSVADIYSAFGKEKSYVNAALKLNTSDLTKSTINLDPHPTVAGHAKMAETVAAAAGVQAGSTTETTPTAWVNPFTDVKSSDWFFSAVQFANETKLMVGTTDTTFSPNTNMSRAMILAVLFRQSGAAPSDMISPFSDVENASWYYDASNWAYENGILENIDCADGKLKPNAVATREELAVMLYNYAKLVGADTTQGGMAIREVDDYLSISESALQAMAWCLNSGIMSGTTKADGSWVLMPKDGATRAAFAQMMKMYAEIPMLIEG